MRERIGPTQRQDFIRTVVARDDRRARQRGEDLAGFARRDIIGLAPELGNFADTAAVASNLDLVLTRSRISRGRLAGGAG